MHIGLRVPPGDYEKFKKICADSGLSLSSVMKAVVHRTIREQNLGFVFSPLVRAEVVVKSNGDTHASK